MAVRTRTELKADIDASVTANGARTNTGGALNARLKDIADSVKLAEDLGDAAARNVGTGAGSVAAGDDGRITGAIQASLLTTRGDLLVRGASIPARLAIGAADRLLGSNGTDPSWGQLTAGMVPAALLTFAMLASSAYISSGQYRSKVASKLLTAAGVWDDAAVAGLTDASNIAFDMSTGLNLFEVTGGLAGNRVLSNPSNPKVGQFFSVKLTAASSARTLTLGANYDPENLVEAFPISIATTETVYLSGFVETASVIRLTSVLRF